MKVLIVLLVLAILQTPPTTPRKAAKTDSSNTENVQNKAPIQKAPSSNTESKEHIIVEKVVPEKDAWDKSAILINAALAVIAALTLIAVVYQAIQTRDATKAMERSTGITTEIERGRIVTYWEQTIHANLSPTGVHNGRLEPYFNWSCGNSGKTPAQLTAVWSRFIVINNLSDLPEKPEYDVSKDKLYEGEPLEPNSKKPQTMRFATKLETDLPFDQIQEKTRSGQCVLYAYGYARYRDIWNNPHVTRFGIVRVITDSIMKDAWKVAGPPEYNRSE